MTNLQRQRIRAGITQQELSERTGVSIRTIQSLERGQSNINKTAVITVIKIADVLKCSIYDVIEAE